ncbi:keratin, type I cytoskeletal 19-like [Protopterus annectens]|uniref:keratin, type I cytoskeletal 19-like n=1 Tax=Protopterus annectens TaxID=7888 RepID=UPI001CFB19F4|nr:keratin, type I cytoskeletal 19-like [Protopterus annectens]
MTSQVAISRQSRSVRGPSSSTHVSQRLCGSFPVAQKAYSVCGARMGGRTQASVPFVLGSSGLVSSSYGGLGSAAGCFGGGFSSGSGLGGGASFGGGAGFGSFSATLAGAGDGGFLSGNEKATMQNLNDRLASYLTKVHDLEKENSALELKIKDWYLKQTHGGEGTGRDYSEYEKTIDDLRDKIQNITVGNANILLSIDNAKLAADDFRLKYENELNMRQCVEADINGMRRLLDDLTLSRADLESQIECMKEDLAYTKKNHADEISSLHSHVTGNINVEVDAAPGTDMMKALAEIRHDYETIIEKNNADAEAWFNKQASELSKEMTVSTEALQTHKTEITDLRRTLQGLEIELQAQLAKKGSLDNTLRDTESRYGTMLQDIQISINNLEASLANIRSEIECQSREYQLLLDVKTRLEKEINDYRQLLEGEDGRYATSSGPKSSLNIKTIVEEYKDGKKISQKEERHLRM